MDLPAYVLFLQNGYGEMPEPRANRTPMEDGMVKQSTNASRVLVGRPLQALLRSKADYQAFKTWYYTDIGRVGWFNVTDPVDGVVKQMRFVGGKVEFKALRKNYESWMLTFQLESWNT